MRAAFIVWFCTVGVCGSIVGKQTQFPYELTVVDGPVDVRSGPGEQYYATDKLPAGAKIQVYRHDGDWLAIRPPEGSYSLVDNGRLKETNQAGVAKVTKDDVRCHVGSNVTQVGEPVSWVRLRKDELVELLGEENAEIGVAAGDAGKTWRRISPPAGEFRWVKAADVQQASLAGSRTPRSVVPDRDVIRIPADHEESHVSVGASQEQDASTGGETSEAGDTAIDKWTARNPRSPDSLTDIELQLSLMVAKDMRTWRLEQLRDRVEGVVEKLGSEEDRSRAQLLLDRIEEFEELQNRFVQTMGDSHFPDIRLSDAPASDTAAAAVERATGVRYDGTGWLVPVHSTKQTAPPYALLDAEGDVLQYVSPAPGLNLHRYVRKQVGLFGHRGDQQSFKKPHLTAERVVDLGRHLH